MSVFSSFKVRICSCLLSKIILLLIYNNYWRLNIVSNKVDTLTTSLMMMQNRLISMSFANKTLNITHQFRHCRTFILNNNLFIEDLHADNNVQLDIDAIIEIKQDLFIDYVELIIALNDGTVVQIHTI